MLLVDSHGGAHGDLPELAVLLDFLLHDAELGTSARQFLPRYDALPVILRRLTTVSLLEGLALGLALEQEIDTF